MPQRFTFVPEKHWAFLGPAFKGINADMTSIESDVAALKAGGGGGGGTATGTVAWGAVTDKPTFAAVATTGAYGDLTGTPVIPDTGALAPKASPTFTGTVTLTGTTIVGLSGAAITSGTIAPARLATGTPAANTYLSGDSTWKAMNKWSVGLDKVDNTADAAKTFTAAQTTSGTFTADRLGTGAVGDGTRILADNSTWITAPTGTGIGNTYTIVQNTDNTWPTLDRKTGMHVRWLCRSTDPTTFPKAANGLNAGDELVTADGTTVAA